MARLRVPAASVLLLVLVGCSGAAEPGAHSHPDGPIISLPVGDGTESEKVGYELADVSWEQRADTTGEVRFRIESFRGEPVTAYLEELTKDLHLYVVRDDLTLFRHLHPAMAADGTWSAPVSLPLTGSYRVIAEFVAEDSGGNGDHVILGERLDVTGADDDPAPADTALEVEVTESPEVSPNGRMTLTVRDAAGRPVRLGTYLGTYGHVTGFHRETGAMLHMHPLTGPEVTEDGSSLDFHTEIVDAGDYRLFVQARVDGFLHTVPVDVAIGEPAA